MLSSLYIQRKLYILNLVIKSSINELKDTGNDTINALPQEAFTISFEKQLFQIRYDSTKCAVEAL